MSKRILLPLLIMALALGLSVPAMASRTGFWRFQIEVQVEPWIGKNPGLPQVMKMDSLAQEQERVSDVFGWYESFYSNVPFSKTFSGDNPAGDGYPIFAREELSKAGRKLGRFDRLSTKITFETVVNGLGSDPYREDWSIVFGCSTQNSPGMPPPIPGYTYWWWNRNSHNFGTPHDGEVWEKFFVTADRKMPDFNTDNEWYESADAGIYTLIVYETLIALNTPQSADAFVIHP